MCCCSPGSAPLAVLLLSGKTLAVITITVGTEDSYAKAENRIDWPRTASEVETLAAKLRHVQHYGVR